MMPRHQKLCCFRWPPRGSGGRACRQAWLGAHTLAPRARRVGPGDCGFPPPPSRAVVLVPAVRWGWGRCQQYTGEGLVLVPAVHWGGAGPPHARPRRMPALARSRPRIGATGRTRSPPCDTCRGHGTARVASRRFLCFSVLLLFRWQPRGPQGKLGTDRHVADHGGGASTATRHAVLAAVAPHNPGFQTVILPGAPRVCALSIRTIAICADE